MRGTNEERAIADVVARLTARYPMRDPAEISAAVERVHGRFESCAVRDYVPLLVERHVHQEFAESLGATAV